MLSKGFSISVVIPAYNCERTILRAIKSVTSQTSASAIAEINIIDDGSTDSTYDIVSKFIKDSKAKVKINIFTQKNQGVSVARNNGISRSRGEWIALLDADDSWLPKKIELSVKAILKHTEISVLGSNRDNLMRTHGTKIDDNLYKLSVRDELFIYWPSTPTLMFKKEVIARVGGYDEGRTHAEDGDFLLRLAAAYGVYYLHDSLIITDDKPAYGASGLSGDNLKMHEGCITNIVNARERGDISTVETLLFKAWENIKYSRRLIITFLRCYKRW